jgi:hypothetical protein
MSSDEEPAPADGGAWELWRQDDNGNRFRIGRFATENEADEAQRRFEALAHKQIYWVEHHGGVAGVD